MRNLRLQTGKTRSLSNVRAVWGHYESNKRVNMIDVILGIIISLNALALFHLYFKTNAIENAIKEGIDNVEMEIPGLDSLKDEITDTIIQILNGMHTPTFMDHIGGAIGGLIQARTARMVQDMVPQEQIQEGIV
jgi:hypothetical protein